MGGWWAWRCLSGFLPRKLLAMPCMQILHCSCTCTLGTTHGPALSEYRPRGYQAAAVVCSPGPGLVLRRGQLGFQMQATLQNWMHAWPRSLVHPCVSSVSPTSFTMQAPFCVCACPGGRQNNSCPQDPKCAHTTVHTHTHTHCTVAIHTHHTHTT